MTGMREIAMFKFLPGIILIQLITAGLLLTAFNWSQDPQLIVVIVVFSLITGILTAFWFASIARTMVKVEQTQLQEQHAEERERILLAAERDKAYIAAERAKLQEQHAREREKILIDAEREKANIAAESFRQIEKETRKAHAKANFKVGFAFATAVGVGGIMLFSQLITVGMMVLVASGSGLAGYLTRARQERLSRIKRLSAPETKLIGNSKKYLQKLNRSSKQ
jgi:ABC-type multidrug transport system fused ATPase/permease subunit